jgi:hypothetical protein
MNLKSKAEAKKVIEKLFPKKEARDAYLAMFKEAIAQARSYGEKKWGVSLHTDRVRLIIGNLVVCTLHKGYMWLVLPGEEYPDFTSPKEIPGWDTDSYGYKSISSITGDYHYSKAYHKKAWPQIKEQHFKFLELAAEKYKKLHSKSLEKHSPGVLKYIGVLDRGVNGVVKRPEPNTKKPSELKTGSLTVNSFKSVIKDINLLKKDRSHTEKAHEVLVASFYEKLGYESFTDIKYQTAQIDIAIETKKRILIVNEVKRSWHLSDNMDKALRQAYLYALKVGAKYVVITNGDYYAIFDRDKGRSYDDHFVGDFHITELTKDKLDLIRILMKK